MNAAAKPVRIQLSRKKGWKMPPNTVVVSRPSKWGNPFKIDAKSSRKDVVRLYRDWLYDRTSFQFEIIRELRGKNLACWCPMGEPCHADLMLRVANHGLLRTRTKNSP